MSSPKVIKRHQEPPSNEEIISLKRTIEELSEILESEKEKEHLMTMEIDKLKCIIQIKNEEIGDVRNKMEASCRRNFPLEEELKAEKEKNKRLLVEINELKKTNANWSNDLSVLKESNKKLIELSSDHCRTIDQLRSKLKASQAQIADLESDKLEWGNNRSAVLGLKEALKKEKDQAVGKLTRCQEEVNRLSEEKEDLAERLSTAQKRCRELEETLPEEIRQLKSDLEEISRQCQEFEKEKGFLKQRYENACKEIVGLKAEKRIGEDQNKKLMDQIKESEIVLSDQQRRGRDCLEQERKTKKMNEELRGRLDKCQVEFERLHEEIKQLIRRHEIEKRNLNERIQEMQEALSNKEAKSKEQVEQKLKEIQEALETKEKAAEMDKKLRALQEENDFLKKEADSFRLSGEEADSRANKMQREFEEILREMERELESERAQRTRVEEILEKIKERSLGTGQKKEGTIRREKNDYGNGKTQEKEGGKNEKSSSRINLVKNYKDKTEKIWGFFWGKLDYDEPAKKIGHDEPRT